MDTVRDLRAVILQTADRLFYSHGIHAVGINRLIDESGVAKDSFYRYFRAKESLIVAYLQARHDASARHFEALTTPIKDPRVRLRTIFEDLVCRLQREGYRGCAFMMAMAEYGHVPAVADIIRSHKERTRGSFELICQHINPDSQKTARQLSLLYEGFIARWSVARDAEDQAVLLAAVDEVIAGMEEAH